MKNWFLLIFSLIAAFILFIALSLFYNREVPDTVALDEPIRVILKSNETDPMDFWDVVKRGINEAAKEFGVDVAYSGPQHESMISRQIAIMDQVIETNPPHNYTGSHRLSTVGGTCGTGQHAWNPGYHF